MVKKKKLREVVDEYISSLGLFKMKDEQLKYSDGYFVDKRQKKYLIYTIFFENKCELINKWKKYQYEDIAYYLQKQKYSQEDIRWDFYYLIIYNGENLDVEEISMIERDLFSCKKIVVNFNDNLKEFIDTLNQKLPLTLDYYPRIKTNTISDQDFFADLRNKIGFNKDLLTDDILFNISENKEKIEKLFSEMEVVINE